MSPGSTRRGPRNWRNGKGFVGGWYPSGGDDEGAGTSRTLEVYRTREWRESRERLYGGGVSPGGTGNLWKTGDLDDWKRSPLTRVELGYKRRINQQPRESRYSHSETKQVQRKVLDVTLDGISSTSYFWTLTYLRDRGRTRSHFRGESGILDLRHRNTHFRYSTLCVEVQRHENEKNKRGGPYSKWVRYRLAYLKINRKFWVDFIVVEVHRKGFQVHRSQGVGVRRS